MKRETSVFAWFYAILRNAIADFYRARARQEAKFENYAQETARVGTLDERVYSEVCECFRVLLPSLKVSYATVLEQVDLQGRPIAEMARELQITPNNLMVRLHRGRQALKTRLEEACGACAEHGCLNCTCNGKL